MEKTKFSVLLPIIVGGLASKIMDEMNIGEDEAIDRLYYSELYAELENEETKVWTYSVPKLFDLFQTEINTGKLALPEY